MLPSLSFVNESTVVPGEWTGYVASDVRDSLRIHFLIGRTGVPYVTLFCGSSLVKTLSSDL